SVPERLALNQQKVPAPARVVRDVLETLGSDGSLNPRGVRLTPLASQPYHRSHVVEYDDEAAVARDNAAGFETGASLWRRVDERCELPLALQDQRRPA